MKTCIVIAGPTAVGKTAVAIQLAKYLQTEIISADSRQCFRELNIGVAKPSDNELQEVRHHFINSYSIHETVTAVTFEEYALSKSEELFRDHDNIIMTGGTGMYIKAFTDGFDEIPEVPNETRDEIIKCYKEHGLEWLHRTIEQEDPLFFSQGEIQNPQRSMRALEVVRATGKSILEFRSSRKKERAFRIIKILLDLPREELYDRINQRVDNMISDGLVEEVKSLIPFKHLNALQTVGYKELFDHFDGKCSFDQAIDNIKKNTRHYAKRQQTWFRRDERFLPCAPAFEEVLKIISS